MDGGWGCSALMVVAIAKLYAVVWQAVLLISQSLSKRFLNRFGLVRREMYRGVIDRRAMTLTGVVKPIGLRL